MYKEGDNGTPEGREVPEELMYSGQEQEDHIILNTGSKYNMMGTDMKKILKKRLKEAGASPPTVMHSDKLFRFGGNET